MLRKYFEYAEKKIKEIREVAGDNEELNNLIDDLESDMSMIDSEISDVHFTFPSLT